MMFRAFWEFHREMAYFRHYLVFGNPHVRFVDALYGPRWLW